MAQITVRVSEGLEGKIRERCSREGDTVASWVRGVVERELGHREDSRMGRVLERLDRLEDSLGVLESWQAEVQSMIDRKTQRRTSHTELVQEGDQRSW